MLLDCNLFEINISSSFRNIKASLCKQPSVQLIVTLNYSIIKGIYGILTYIQQIIHYCKLLKYTPHPLFHTTFRQKWEGGVCSNIQFVSCIRLLLFLVVFLKTASSLKVYYGKSAVLTLMLRREALKKLASSVVTGEDSA